MRPKTSLKILITNTRISIKDRVSVIPIIYLILFLIIGEKLAAQAKPWPVPAQAASLQNPIPGNPAIIKEARTLYTSYCSPCHGDKGKGDGPAAAALNPKPADHSSSYMLKETDGSLYYKMSEGRTPMPGYKKTLTDNQRWELVDYIRTLNLNGKK